MKKIISSLLIAGISLLSFLKDQSICAVDYEPLLEIKQIVLGDRISESVYDTNNDGEINVLDVVRMKQINYDFRCAVISNDHYTLTVENFKAHSTNIHAVDVRLSDITYLKTAFAGDGYGHREKTSDIARRVGASFAVNGDYHGARYEGIVIRDGVLYRNRPSDQRDTFAVMRDGTCKMICPESETSGEVLLEEDALHVFSFGPGLVRDEEILVTEDQEVNGNHIGNTNPRSAIGYIEPNHFIFVTTDGRGAGQRGLTLYEMAEIMRDKGAKLAYNLDGGGSATMYYDGRLLNRPSSGTSGIDEREISDIIYVGGE